jgi:hypothetical protein
VLVAFAATGGTPSATSAGKVSSVPPQQLADEVERGGIGGGHRERMEDAARERAICIAAHPSLTFGTHHPRFGTILGESLA